ncbi:hypothetical protein NNC19_15545 [Clostridium sp. SHJSY1]|uniref:hypothetical protein n=1 Tax=Clostridium sp. SHJSY1 TaxID=2942483 RepID=UPI0028760F93|nr:hypothetical protein [Clostridium sp. SHJSY1]MDS0527105.1 hypothetical protein [Clostridium sp. SHJSY1]
MIRHLTSESNYNSIIQDEIIKKREKDGRDKGTISFEILNENNIFVNLYKSGRKNLKAGEKIVGIIIDDEELIEAGVSIYYTDSSSINSRQRSKYTTKFENLCFYVGNELDQDYIKIGEYAHVEGDIPISFIKRVEFY